MQDGQPGFGLRLGLAEVAGFGDCLDLRRPIKFQFDLEWFGRIVDLQVHRRSLGW